MRRSSRAIAFVLVLVSFFAFALPAFAAPIGWKQVEVTLHSEQSGGVMLVAGDLPEDASLPAEIELSVPAGARLMWIGELLGGDPSADPSLTYTKTTTGDVDVYRATMTKGRSAQIEVGAPVASSADGVNFTSTLRWASAVAVPRVLLSVRVPAGARITQDAEGATLTAADAAYAFYSTTVENVKAGQKLDLSFAYAASGAPVQSGVAPASASGSDSVLVIAMLFVAAVGIALVAVVVRTRLGSRRGDDVASADDDARPADESDEPAVDEAPSAAPRRGAGLRLAIAGVIVLVLAALVVVVVVQAAKPRVVGDTISQVFAGGEPCEIANVNVAAPAGSDPVDTAQALFGALKSAKGINDANYTVSTSVLRVGYCGSQTTEAQVLGALTPTGLVGAASPAPDIQTAPSTGTPAPQAP